MKKLTSKKQLILYGCSGLGINMLSLFMGSYLCSALQVGGFIDNREYWTYLDKDIVVYALWTVLYFLANIKAIFTPSIAEVVIPPAYPAPSPIG